MAPILAAPAPEIHALSRIAPRIALTVTWEPDYDFVWDGDGPDPTDAGYQAYDVKVSAKTVVDGSLLVGDEYLGGSYAKPGQFDPDINGYLPQLLQEAVIALGRQIPGRRALQGLRDEVKAAKEYLTTVMHRRYAEQQR